MVVGLILGCYGPEQNSPVRPCMLSEPIGSLKVYMFGGLFTFTFRGESIAVLGLPLSQRRQK